LANWDVFHSERLELVRAVDTAGVIDALARGELGPEDLIRVAGSSDPWARIGDRPALLEAAAVGAAPAPRGHAEETPAGPAERAEPAPSDFFDDPDDEDDYEEEFPSGPEPAVERLAGPLDEAEHAVLPDPSAGAARGPDSEPFSEFDLSTRKIAGDRGSDLSSVEVAAIDDGEGQGGADDEDDDGYDPIEEDEAVAEFTLSRNRPETVEELDLAAMVDVAFQLVLFFLVTATTVLYKSLEVPRPDPEAGPPAAAAQGKSRTLDDLKEDFILVEVDPAGAIKLDREPVAADLTTLVARLREARERTNRQGMLLSADFSTPHRNAVLVYDAANEARLNIAIARPTRPD